MITPQFEESYKRLNPEQKQAVDMIEGPVMVIAGPGTGKTQILTLRIANILLKTQVNPANILAMTFTEAAAREMRSRLVEMIGTDGYKVEINTFHGFCNDVIKNYPENFPHLIASEPVTDVERIQFAEVLILNSDLNYLRPFGDPLYYVKSVISEIDNLKKEAVAPEDFEAAVAQQKQDFDQIEDLLHEKGRYKGEMKGKYQDLKKAIAKNEELLILYRAYSEFLLKQKVYDFNDMLFEVKAMMEKDRGFLLTLQEKYQYILVDEHQDTNALQNRIVQLLGDFFEEPNIFVVGDEKQAIFRFQGASLENFLAFRNLYPGAKLISLVQNYRSHQKILDVADSLIEKNLGSHLLLPERVKLQAQKKESEEPVKLAVLNDYFAEWEYVAAQIAGKKDAGIKLSEIAVIGRNNKDLQIMADVLERHSISYNINSDANILNDIYIVKLIIIFRAVAIPGAEIELLKAMHVDFFGIEPVDVYKIVEKARGSGTGVYDFLNDLREEQSEELKLESFKSLKLFNTKIRDWQKRASNTPFENFFVEVINESGFKLHLLLSPRRYELVDKLIALFEEIKDLTLRSPDFSLEDFINHLELLKKHEIALKTNVRTIVNDSVNLMTAHRSKGLEFDYVFLINAFDGHWGNTRKKSNGFQIPWDILGIKLNLESEENEDERRLFYVALTRARKDIVISYSSLSMSGKEQIRSQFIGEINEELIEELDISEFEVDFLQNKDQVFSIPESAKVRGPADYKEFFQKLFLRRGLSATGLDNYLSCPWKFFYRNLLSFPDVKSKHQIYGTLMHMVMSRLLNSQSGNPDARKSEEDLNRIIRMFEESVRKSPLLEIEMKELLKKGGEVIPKIYEQLVPQWKEKKVLSEMTVNGVRFTDGLVLNGRLDMIEFPGEEGKVVVHDFKTGKPKSRNVVSGLTAGSDTNYLRQLTFYKILLDRYHEGKMQMQSGVIDFIEPDEKGRFKSEYFDITEQEVKVLEDQIRFIANEIRELNFWNSFCDDEECEYCELRRLTGEVSDG